MATSRDVLAIDERAERALNAHDLKAIEELYSPDAELTWPGGIVHHGRRAIVEHWKNEFEAFPDMHGAVQARVVQGDHVATEFTMTGTNSGPQHMPDGSAIPPTGKTISVHAAAVVTAADGQIVRDHYYFDEVEVLTQLGLMPGQAPLPQASPEFQGRKTDSRHLDPGIFW